MLTDAVKHHTDDTSSSSCCAEPMNTVIKREVHTPTTDQSEDSGVDVSANAAGSNDGRGPYCKRKRQKDDDDDYDECPIAAKSNRTADATAAMLSVNMAVVAAGRKNAATSTAGIGCPPFRPWKNEESSSDVGLRLFHDIRNVDRILTLTQRRKEPTPPPPEPQPLDLTKDRRRLTAPVVGTADDGTRCTVDIYSDATPEHVVSAVTTAPTTTVAETRVVQTTSVTEITDNTTSDPCTITRYSKNMSRARRIEANARERSRVHTISAAFDTLRASIPSYSRNQKLSKLSTIRIASAYILTLSRLLDMDYSAEQNRPSVDECMNNITGIIHMEGKAKKRKDEQ